MLLARKADCACGVIRMCNSKNRMKDGNGHGFLSGFGNTPKGLLILAKIW
jgi:hypothetical protein